jgi:hypothetical protein
VSYMLVFGPPICWSVRGVNSADKLVQMLRARVTDFAEATQARYLAATTTSRYSSSSCGGLVDPRQNAHSALVAILAERRRTKERRTTGILRV